RLGHLLRLAFDVVDDVVRTDEHARAALAAAAEGNHLVHHLLEGDLPLPHDGRTLAYRCRQRKRGPAPANPLAAGGHVCDATPGTSHPPCPATASRTGRSTSSQWVMPRASRARSVVRTPACSPRWGTDCAARRSPERRRRRVSPPIRSATRRSPPCSPP